MVIIDGCSVTEANDTQPWKALLPIRVTNDGGSVMAVNDVQP